MAKETEQGPAWPANVAPQVFHTVLYHGDEFNMLEEEAANEVR
jgi:hypothetical protein